MDKVIGKGAFGKVYRGTHILTGEPVAMKMIKKTYLQKSEHAKRKVFQEIYILRKIRHPYVVQLFEVFETSKCIVLVMEYCAGGDLLHFIRGKRRLTESEARRIFK